MKKYVILIIFLFIPIISSCSVQEKMSPEIFVERFTDLNQDLNVTETALLDSNRYILFFTDSNSEFVCELLSDELKNVKKICLACIDTDKTDLFKKYSEKIIETYAPYEDSSAIISDLFSQNWDFETTQWYKYSSVISDKGMYFCIENMKLSTNTDAELTLKPNDIINP